MQVRAELQTEIKRQRISGRCYRQPEVTTKHGKLKSDRKAQPKKMYFDDLAALDVLTEVCKKNTCTSLRLVIIHEALGCFKSL